MAAAMEATGLATKKATVEEALRPLVCRNRQMQAVTDRTALVWKGDLDAIRLEKQDAERSAS